MKIMCSIKFNPISWDIIVILLILIAVVSIFRLVCLISNEVLVCRIFDFSEKMDVKSKNISVRSVGLFHFSLENTDGKLVMLSAECSYDHVVDARCATGFCYWVTNVVVCEKKL